MSVRPCNPALSLRNAWVMTFFALLRRQQPPARHFRIEFDQDEDGRWIADVPELPGVLVYGATRLEAAAKAEALAFRVLAERLEHGEAEPGTVEVSLAQPV
jgi:predicted RNase H-like HicB family nuclease